jgi:putative aldouronate transport system permease protein
MNEKAVAQPKKKMTAGQYLKKNWPLYTMLLIPMAYVILFKYVPMAGLAIAFKKFNVFKGIWGSPWIGFDYFVEAFQKVEFWKSVKNTLIINLGDLLFCWPFPIFLAIVMSEMSRKNLAKWTQTILYIPHFLSNVIIFGIIFQVFGPTGAVNNVLRALGNTETIGFLTNVTSWRLIYWGSAIWEGAGYGMIVYLAAIAGINTELYDAAYMDGAGRWKRIWHITLPQIKPTVVTILVMNLGKILSISFEKPYLMANAVVRDEVQVISTYVYSVGLQAGRYDYAAAVGIFQSVVALVMVLTANWAAKKLGEEGIM